MKKSFTLFCTVLFSLFATTGAWAQTDGDYQTHTGGPGNWNNTASWEFRQAGAWVTPAPQVPNNNLGVGNIITIKDNITLDLSVTISNTVVQSGATLSINQTGGITLTIAKRATTDLDILNGGTLVMGDVVPTGDETIAGSGASPAIVIESGGTLTWNSGTIGVQTTVAAGGTATLTNANIAKSMKANFTNNGTMTWNSGSSSGGLDMTAVTFTNGGTLIENFSSDRGFIDNGSNGFINTGIYTKSTTHGFFTNGIPVTNSGTIQGKGTIDLGGSSFTNSGTGMLAPGASNGSSVAILNVTPNVFNTNATTLNINITGAGNTPGTDFSQLVSIGSGTPNPPLTPDVTLAGAKLTVTDAGTAPALTDFVILDAGAGTITGTFNATIPPNFTIAYSQHNVTVTKQTVLPLTWGPFNATLNGNDVVLNWSTYAESNTSHFVIGYSTDGKTYTSIGSVNAAGNSTKASSYTFTHTNPNLNGANYYRLQEVDLDGKAAYSSVRVVNMSNKQVLKVLATPNPVRDLLQLSVQENGIIAYLYTVDGKALRTWQLQPGTQQVSIGELPAGNYQLVVFQKGQRVEAQHITKL